MLPKLIVNLLWSVGSVALVYPLFFLFSTVQIVLVVVALVFGVAIFLFKHRGYHSMYKYLRVGVVFVMIFALAFGAVQLAVFTICPSPSAPQVNYPPVSSISFSQSFDDLEQSASFHLLEFTHIGTVEFEGLEVNSYKGGGWLRWDFTAKDTSTQIDLIGVKATYFTSVRGLLATILPYQEYTARVFPMQTAKEGLRQIDALGIGYFQNTAAAYYENHTGTKADIAALNLHIGYSDTNGYGGISLTLDARAVSQDERGNTVYPGIFQAEFTPNGELLSLKNL
jgi:hypothetical protein